MALCAGPLPAQAGSNVAVSREQRAAAAQAALLSIAQQLVVFSYGAQTWTNANVTGSWNTAYSNNPLQSNPILLYAGNPATCGTPKGVGYSQTVNLSTTTDLPSGFLVSLSGADCAVVYPYYTTMTAPSGIKIGVNLLVTYFAPSPTALDIPGSILTNMTPSYVTRRVQSLVAQLQGKTSGGIPIGSTGSSWATTP